MSKVIEITESEALQLKGKEYTKDMYFNPIEDKNGKWVISEEEVKQYKKDKENFDFIKTKPLKEHKPKIEKDPFKKIKP